MDWKSLILSLIAVVAVSLYAFITGAHPDFPLSQEKFVAVILWAVGLLFAGWQLMKYKTQNSGRLRTFRGEIAAFDWKPIVKALLLVLLPIVYNLLVGWDASFPLPKEDFVAIILFLFGIPIGGWQLAKSVYKGQGRLIE